MKRNIQVSLATLTVVMTLVLATAPAFAQGTTPTNHPNFFQGFIDFISQKFGLDKTQVQSAVKDYRTQRKANITPRPTLSPEQMTQKEKTRLDKFVTDGKISSAQEQAILTELNTLRTKYSPDSLKNLSPQERRTKMQQMHDEIVSWAQSQGIDSSYVMPFFGRGMGGKFGVRMMRGKGNWQKPTTTPTPSV